MSTFEEAVVSYTGADAGVAALTSSFHPLVAPQAATPPYVVYQLISNPELQLNGYVMPRLQLACWGASYSEAVELANAVRNCWYNKHMTVLGVHLHSWVANQMDGNRDETTKRCCRIVDVRFTYRNIPT